MVERTSYFLIVFFIIVVALMKHLRVEVLTVKHGYLVQKCGGSRAQLRHKLDSDTESLVEDRVTMAGIYGG